MALHLITGVTGQDGVHLARALTAAGHDVLGTHRPGSPPAAAYLTGPHVPGRGSLVLAPLDVTDDAAFAALLDRHRPAVVHHLAALSSVGDSWAARAATDEVCHRAVVRMLARLEAHAQRHGVVARLLLASSAEVFGAAGSGAVLDERSPLRPVSPYGEAKARAQEAVAAARDRGLDAASLVLFSHTGVLHAPRFVLPRIARQAAEAALGRRESLAVRDPSVERDWGSAVDVVRAFVATAALPAGTLTEVVVATGRTHRLADVAAWASAAAGLPDAVLRDGDGDAARPHDVTGVRGDPGLAGRLLGWRPEISLRAEVERMVAADLHRLRTGREIDPAVLDLPPGLAPQG